MGLKEKRLSIKLNVSVRLCTVQENKGTTVDRSVIERSILFDCRPFDFVRLTKF